ncbi:MAG TPA: hypothetical protein VHJ34_11110 [Actinomycetota bacterium]|nr:hypothetical protein [Actinomycetota bacterium]
MRGVLFGVYLLLIPVFVVPLIFGFLFAMNRLIHGSDDGSPNTDPRRLLTVGVQGTVLGSVGITLVIMVAAWFDDKLTWALASFFVLWCILIIVTALVVRRIVSRRLERR